LFLASILNLKTATGVTLLAEGDEGSDFITLCEASRSFRSLLRGPCLRLPAGRQGRVLCYENGCAEGALECGREAAAFLGASLLAGAQPEASLRLQKRQLRGRTPKPFAHFHAQWRAKGSWESVVNLFFSPSEEVDGSCYGLM
jgi:hypothetical protein